MRRALPTVALLWVALGCAREPAAKPAEAPLPTVDVTPHVDSGASTEADPRAAARPVETISGVLPGDFPRDFPLPAGGSIIDLGAAPSFVVLRYGAPANDVLRRVSGLAQSRGWTREQNRYTRGSHEVRISATAQGLATDLRLDYQRQ